MRASLKNQRSLHHDPEPCSSGSFSSALPVPRDTFRADRFAEGSLESASISLRAISMGLLYFRPPSWNFPRPVILFAAKILSEVSSAIIWLRMPYPGAADVDRALLASARAHKADRGTYISHTSAFPRRTPYFLYFSSWRSPTPL